MFFFVEFGKLLLKICASQLKTLNQVLLLGVDYALRHGLIFDQEVKRVLERELSWVRDVGVGGDDSRRSELLVDQTLFRKMNILMLFVVKQIFIETNK